MTTPTIHGAEHDLAVIREVRDRILAGDWEQGVRRANRCLLDHLLGFGGPVIDAVEDVFGFPAAWLGRWNDTHTQAEVVALLDDVEDSLLGELGVLS